MYLYGEKIKAPLLRFNFSSTIAQDSYPKRGLSQYGPYDYTLLNKSKIDCFLIYVEKFEREKNILIESLIDGKGHFDGFQSFFKIPINFIDEIPVEESLQKMNIQLEIISKLNPDFVFIILPKYSELYIPIKKNLLGNGIPNQVLLADKLSQEYGRQYYLENVSLATYAKIGGTPWVVSRINEQKPLIVGVSRSQDINKSYFVGFVTLFTQDGDFIFMNSKAPAIKWEDYVEGLTSLVEDSIIEFSQKEKYEPDSLIFHFYKNPGKKEINAIETALTNLDYDIPYALIHINEYSNFHLFDTSHKTYVPKTRTLVNLSKRESLLLLDGRIGDKRRQIGVPRVVDIRMDKRSTMDLSSFPELIKQISDFSSINWRGFNAAKIPVTINYSKLIAKMISQIGIADWNHIVAQGRLRDKAWFL